MDEIIIGIFKVQSAFALEEWISIEGGNLECEYQKCLIKLNVVSR